MNSPRRYFELSGEAILTIGDCDDADTGWTACGSLGMDVDQPLLPELRILGVSVPLLQNNLSVYLATTSPLPSGRRPFARGNVGLSSVRSLGSPQVKKSETKRVFVVSTAADWPPLLGAPHGTAIARISGASVKLNVAWLVQTAHAGANVSGSYERPSAA